jgi:putative oxidoreductase
MNYPMQSDDAGKFTVRFTVGVLILIHGVSKIIDPGSVSGIGGQMTALGMPAFLAYGVYIGEVLAPLMVVLGIFSRIGGLLIVANMVVAIGMFHVSQIFTMGRMGGWTLELQGFYLLGGLAVYFLGSGRFAVKAD